MDVKNGSGTFEESGEDVYVEVSLDEGTRHNLLIQFCKIHQGSENDFNLIFFLLGVGTFYHELD
jgi:hypothetical protein